MAVRDYIRRMCWQYVGEVEGLVETDGATLRVIWVLQSRRGLWGQEKRRVIECGALYGRVSEHSRTAEADAKVWAAGGAIPAQAKAVTSKPKAPVLNLINGGKGATRD